MKQTLTSEFEDFCKFLYLSNNTDVIPDLLHYIGFDQTIKICNLFGGSFIRIPKASELSESILIFKLLREKCRENLSWNKLQEKHNLDNTFMRKLKKRLKEFEINASSFFNEIIKNE